MDGRCAAVKFYRKANARIARGLVREAGLLRRSAGARAPAVFGLSRERFVAALRAEGVAMDEGFRADIVVDRRVILEIKAVAAIVPTHESQLQTYLRMSGIPIGLIFNFNASRLIDGLRRFVV